MPDTLLLTDHSPFYKAVNADETRYYPQTKTNGENRALAGEFDAAGDPPIVMGFAVYDTTVSTRYAVALYGDKAQAAAHTPATASAPPTDVFTDNNTPSDDTPDAVDTPPEPKTKSKKSKNPFKK